MNDGWWHSSNRSKWYKISEAKKKNISEKLVSRLSHK